MQVFYSLMENNQSLKLRAKDCELPLEAVNKWVTEEYLPYFRQPFVINHGKRVKDIIAYFECGLIFISDKFKAVLSDYVPDINQYLAPISIEGIDSQYYVFHDLPEYGKFLNNNLSYNSPEEITCFSPYPINMHLFAIKGSKTIMLSKELKEAVIKAKISNIYFNTYYGADNYDEYLKNKSFLQNECKADYIKRGLFYFVFRHATKEDIPVIEQMISNSKIEIHEKGGILRAKSIYTLKHIKENIEREEAYLMEVNDRVEGYVVVSCNGSIAYDHIRGEWLSNDGKFAVIQHLAVKAPQEYVGATANIIDHVKYMAKEQGLTSIRFDIGENNSEMLAVIEYYNLYKTRLIYCGELLSPRITIEKRLAYELLLNSD